MQQGSLHLSVVWTTTAGLRTCTELRASPIAAMAVDALIAEAMLTPKPALVDQRGSGAHRDLDLERLLLSARCLHETFLELASVAVGREPDQALREQLASIGRAGESTMFAATRGANAHRGAIWVVGLLVAAQVLAGADATPRRVTELAGRIAQFEDRFAPIQDRHGLRACARYGVRGARGEVQDGFPHVIDVGLPALWSARARGCEETYAQLDALLSIMSSLMDTCLLHRGGRAALQAAQFGARSVLAAGGSSTPGGWRRLRRLDTDLLTLNASPGGCADLLAACLFLDRSLPSQRKVMAWKS